MKIGILTYHSVYNFGANLQAYSTAGYLKNHGFEPVIINWIPEDLEIRSNRSVSAIQADAHNEFIRNNLRCTRLCRSDDDIISVIEQEGIDGIIHGSDAILQHRPFLSRIYVSRKGITLKKIAGTDVEFPNPFWGSYISGLSNRIPIVTISASAQNTNFHYIFNGLRKKMGDSLLQFSGITVRDNWTRRMVTYLTKGKMHPAVTPDPVFAFNQNIEEQYSKEEILKKFGLPEKYIILSFRGPDVVSKEWMQTFGNLAEKDNLTCVALTGPGGIKFDHPYKYIIDIPLDPMEWYCLIKYSSAYVGEQMHPVIIALHNHVPLFSFDFYGITRFKFFLNKKSSKIFDILSMAGLLSNWINMVSKGSKSPSPEYVYKRVQEFDTSKCKLFAERQLEKYNSMMESATSLISGSR